MIHILFILVVTCANLSYGKMPSSLSHLHPPSHPSEKQEVLVRADEVTYEEDLNLVIARGHVQISDGIDVLEADTVTYNKKLNTVSASGDVRLYKATGELITGSYSELTGDMKKGFVDKIYLVTPHDERFAANKGYKDNEITTFEEGVYSPCQLCKTDKHRSLTWQIRASKIIRDEETMDISYRNVVLDFKGVPAFYMPYFKHADPSVERRTGFLMPAFANGGDLGTTVILPFYWSITPQNDITLRPVYMSKENPMAWGNYRGLFSKGDLNLSLSTISTKNITGTPTTQKTNPTQRHGHIWGNTRFDLTDTWRFKGELARVSSPTYFRRYYFLEDGKFYGNGTLDSQGFLEGFYDKNYIALGGYDFQNLRAEVNNKTIPLVTPVAKGDYNSDIDELGGNWNFGLDQNNLTRRFGPKVGRASAWGRYNLPYISAIGTTHTAQAELRGDVYDIRHFKYSSTQPSVRQTRGRAIPTLSLNNGYPFIGYFGKNSMVLEPVLKAITSPDSLNNKKIPNEDSQDFEFDTTNLMKTNRFPGFDLIDGGTRLSYGLNFNFYNRLSEQLVKGFIGQGYSFSKEPQFPQYSGVYKGQSDFVSSLSLIPYKYISFSIRSRFDKKTLQLRKNLVQTTLGPPLLNLNVDYVMVDRQYFNGLYVKREQLTGTLNSQFHDNWSAYIRTTKELGYKPGDLEHGAGLRYQDDCFFSNLDAFRTFYQDRDLKPSKTIMITFGFKNLGTYSTGRLSIDTLGEAVPENPNAPKTLTTPSS